MKTLRIIGWIFIPFIMIFVDWKGLKVSIRAAATAWAVIALLVWIGAINGKANKPALQSAAQATPAATATTSSTPAATSTPTPTPTATPTPTPKPTPTPTPEPPKNKPSMSKAEFDKIQNGMTYEEVTAIIGGPGEVMSEVGTKGDPYYTVMYMYEGEGGFGANANLMFQGGKLMSKAHFGLK